MTYRPNIDGLRAVAVLAVCVYHVNSKWLAGGFIGVDIFFVISGYLITSLIARDFRQGSFSYAEFYRRRIARIVPASLCAAVITLALTTVLYNSMDAASVGATSAAAISGLANIKLLFQGNYFEASPDAQPFLHYWSLSLEEQFYLLYPALYLFVACRAPRAKTLILGTLCGLSFIACVVGTRLNPSVAFYLLPTRAWELLAGCIVASLQGEGRLSTSMRAAGFTGAGLLCVALAATPDGNAFPGWWPAVSVIGTALLLCHVDCQSQINQFLGFFPIVAIGRVSYSLYLWHWPIFSIVDYTLPFATDWLRLMLKVALAAIATAGSFYVVETPCRRWLNAPGRLRTAFAVYFCSLFLGIGLGLYVRAEMYINATQADFVVGGKKFFNGGNSRKVILVGDSHGSMYARSIRNACVREGCDLTVLTIDGGDPLPTFRGRSDLWIAAASEIRRQKPDVIVFACDWKKQLRGGAERLGVALQQVTPFCKCVIIVMQPPLLPENATRSAIRSGSRPPFFEDPQSKADRLETNRLVSLACHRGCQVVDAAAILQSANGDILWLSHGGGQLFQDRNHVSGLGADRVVAEVMKAIVREDNERTAPKDSPNE